MRTIWRGALSFGLVTIPISLAAATRDRSVSFNQLRASDHSRIGYRRVAKADGEEVAATDIVKGFEYEPGRYAVFSAEELDTLKPSTSRSIEILQFVPLEQIDPIYFARSYHLVPEPAGAKAYGLLLRAMRDRSTVAICKITLRDKEHLATLRLRGEVFVLATMHWPDEIADVGADDLDVGEIPEPRPQEVAMAEMLIESLTEDFDPASFSDTYRHRVRAAVQAKIEGEDVAVVTQGGTPAPVVDLTRALQASVEAARKRRAEQEAS